MIDALMMAYTVETVSVEKVMACIRQYSSSSPEMETPYDTEDAATTWINKVGNLRVCVLFRRQNFLISASLPITQHRTHMLRENHHFCLCQSRWPLNTVPSDPVFLHSSVGSLG